MITQTNLLIASWFLSGFLAIWFIAGYLLSKDPKSDVNRKDLLVRSLLLSIFGWVTLLASVLFLLNYLIKNVIGNYPRIKFLVRRWREYWTTPLRNR